MTKPVRLQLRRVKGFNLQKLSHQTNALKCVNVARPSAHGNPFIVGEHCRSREHAALMFELDANEKKRLDPHGFREWLAPLRGKNLACYCPLDEHCHADVLLRLARA